MLATFSLIFLTITIVVSQYYDLSLDPGLPNYIKKALRQKNIYKPFLKEKKRSFKNITLQEVYKKIEAITKSLNENARRNGYKVDYKLRIMNA